MKVAYIAGGMQGYADHNFPSFFAAEHVLKRRGWNVINPATLSQQIGLNNPVEMFLKQDFLAIIQRCDAIFLLPDWQYSQGAVGEVRIGRLLKMPIYHVKSGAPVNQGALDRYASIAPEPRPANFIPTEGIWIGKPKC